MLEDAVDPRTRQTIERILQATLSVILWRGATKMSMSDVCTEAKVSRTTLYRYFPQKEDLLEGLGLQHRKEFERAVREMEKEHTEPVERFLATIELLQRFVDLKRMAHILLIEPQFAVTYMQRHTPFFISLVQEALNPVFDAAEADTSLAIDRAGVVEMLFRIADSAMIMPDGDPLHRFGNMILQAWFGLRESRAVRASTAKTKPGAAA